MLGAKISWSGDGTAPDAGSGSGRTLATALPGPRSTGGTHRGPPATAAASGGPTQAGRCRTGREDADRAGRRRRPVHQMDLGYRPVWSPRFGLPKPAMVEATNPPGGTRRRHLLKGGRRRFRIAAKALRRSCQIGRAIWQGFVVDHSLRGLGIPGCRLSRRSLPRAWGNCAPADSLFSTH
jgi:hypothetical protein